MSRKAEEDKEGRKAAMMMDPAKYEGVAYIGKPSIYTRVKPPKCQKMLEREGSEKRRPDCQLQIKRYNKAGSFSLSASAQRLNLLNALLIRSFPIND
jgi:hypothetical protein